MIRSYQNLIENNQSRIIILYLIKERFIGNKWIEKKNIRLSHQEITRAWMDMFIPARSGQYWTKMQYCVLKKWVHWFMKTFYKPFINSKQNMQYLWGKFTPKIPHNRSYWNSSTFQRISLTLITFNG